MRESNFAFPAQNRACVCITSQLYDRRALDTNAPLPLFNSLTHLTYLTSTSPRIREIMTMDGGLERLVKLLHDFCLCPPPPDNPAMLYGLAPPNTHSPRLPPTLIPKTFDKHAAYRFSLAFQSVVNIGVRGSESIRGRVVQAGTLDVVGCILEAWLASKGFAVGPGATMPGMQRETREQRQAKKQAALLARQREEASQLQRALQRQASIADAVSAVRTPPTQEDDSMDVDMNSSEGQAGSRDTDTSTEPSSNATPARSNTPTGTVMVPGRDRSGTIIARPIWDQTPSNSTAGHSRRTPRNTRIAMPPTSEGASTSHSTDTSRPETETEDDGDVDMDHDGRESDVPVSGASSPERQNGSPERQSTIRASAAHPHGRPHARRAVGIVSDAAPATADIGGDAHIIINDQGGAVDGVGGVEDGIVSLETNDDFAMGAPPGAPGAINGPPANGHGHHAGAGERTPRAGTMALPAAPPVPVPALPATAAMRLRHTDGGAGDQLQRARIRAGGATPAITPVAGLGVGIVGTGIGTSSHHRSSHHRDQEAGPYRDEDVLLALQLLAYLSKYPHVRQAFYKPRPAFHPATILQAQQREKEKEREREAQAQAQAQTQAQGTTQGDDWWAQAGPSTSTSTAGKEREKDKDKEREFGLFGKTLAGIGAGRMLNGSGNGKEREKAGASSSASSVSASASGSGGTTPNTQKQTNVFALVERFTYRPSTAEVESPSPPPTLPPEIQYWASVIMRNACRKDDSRGGIRQCANMMCGKWESYPREFAKCRRCRKAKYCGKECQSIAWSDGHRFWCSAKDQEDDPEHGEASRAAQGGSSSAAVGTPAAGATTATTTTTAGGTITIRQDRRTREPLTARVADFVPRGGMNPSPLAQVAETVRQAPLNLDGATPRRDVAAGNPWPFSPRRRTQPRVDDAGEQGPGVLGLPSPGGSVGTPRRVEGTVTIRAADVELSPEVRRHLVQIIDGTRRTTQIDVPPTAVDMTVAGPSRIRDPGESDNDEPMMIG